MIATSRKRLMAVLLLLSGILLIVLAFVQNASFAQTTPPEKVLAPIGVFDEARDGVTLWHDYGSFALYQVSENVLEATSAEAREQVVLADEMDRILLDAYPFNPLVDELRLPDGLRAAEPQGSALQLVQFVGPIKDEWLKAIETAGGTPVHYIANNAYLVWSDASGRAGLASMAESGDFVQYSAPYQPYFKLGPSLAKRVVVMKNPDELVTVTVQMVRHPGQSVTEELVQKVSATRQANWSPVLGFQNAVVTIRVADVAAIVNLPDVNWVGERFERELMDEIQGQIIANHVAGGSPSGPGYVAWLNGKGFSTNPADYPIVDVVDDGIGTGSVNSGDPTFHELGSLANPTRLAYVSNCTNSATGAGVDGHGHINASIAGGYDIRGGFPFQDPNGYQRGLGLNPYGRLAGTRIFDPGFDLSGCGNTDTGLIKSSQDDGAQITTNSWGCSGCAGTYDDSSQAFDVGVRDADLTEAGNQQMIMIFSAGNSGPSNGTIGTPGNGKNMITVGASENVRPSDEDGAWTDGCAIGPTGADDWRDVIGFSSRGPAPGGRIKPELIAPGTHVQGTASTNPSFTGNSVCDKYRPSGQTTFASSSGTSHSTPGVAGVASLTYYWLESNFGLTPSPAMMKAYLVAHPTYLTGVSANDSLPSNSQGYGMPNLELAFDGSQRFLLDQSVVFNNTGETWTWSGSVADPTKPVRLVLAYTDQAGAIGTSPQVNNLNLSATIGANSYLGNVFSGQWSITGGAADPANNYEAIFVPAGTNGAIDITVTAANIAGDGVPNSGDGTDQDFALVCYNCSQTPDFSMDASPASLDICAPADAMVNVTIGSVLGFSDPVTLSTAGLPVGTTGAFATNPVMPPGSSVLTIGNTGAAAAGTYAVEVTGTSTTGSKGAPVNLNLFDGVPAGLSLASPANGATNVSLAPTFSWSSAAGAAYYSLEVAADPGFSNIVYTMTVEGTTHAAAAPLATSTTYYWRVQAGNPCGPGSLSAAWSFATADIPSILLVDDDDNAPDTRAAYATALDDLGLFHDVWDTGNSDNEPTASTLAPYGIVIWETGDEFGGFAGPGAAGESALSTWLDAGNCLLVSSQDYLYDRGLTSFLSNYLGVGTYSSDVSQSTVTGQGSVFGALGSYGLSFPFTNYSDRVSPGAGAELAFSGSAGDAAVLKDAGYRTSFWGFPLEALPSASARADAMNAFITWCTAATPPTPTSTPVPPTPTSTPPAVSCTTYTSTDVPLRIPSSGTPTVSSSLLVPTGVTIADLNVLNLNGLHSAVGDLDFSLQSPAGTLVQFMSQSCGADDNYYLSLDDEAGGSWPCPPVGGGTYQPSNPLAAFDGQNSAGTWNLIIHDNLTGNGGRLNGWSLEICQDTGGPTPTATPVLPTPTNTPVPPTPTNTPVPVSAQIFVSLSGSGTVGGVSYEDEDVLQYDDGSGLWAMTFDGSDVGVTTNVNAFVFLPDGSLLLSLGVPATVPGVGAVDDSDIVRFVPTSLGATTAGALELYFDGSDVGLNRSGEAIDALGVTSDGRLLISSLGSYDVLGSPGSKEDLLLFTPTSLGANTSGTWELYFDGSDVGLGDLSTENVDGAWLDGGTGDIFLTTSGPFSVTGVSGDGADIFTCSPLSTGSTTACAFGAYWDGSAAGLTGADVDAISLDLP